MQTSHTFTPDELGAIAHDTAVLARDLATFDPLIKPVQVNHWLSRLPDHLEAARVAEEARVKAHTDIAFIGDILLSATKGKRNNLFARLSIEGKGAAMRLTRNLNLE